ncbi:hypothetical protein Dfer_0480 [Dyadobacter fermentans DSM 18053]|uniref:Uncharacterized protein n=1 Tax=Dyadobacter fermentans (strain ATCC 700827 / DSM 18053 / CIP 107007 / KCTC 52180 / NS114) TaxID=471854 RepID=C6VZD7_DYAFD|nr:hypothetical protein Dfer_0480 [Dyadobacter fermentans DSM 18053]
MNVLLLRSIHVNITKVKLNAEAAAGDFAENTHARVP